MLSQNITATNPLLLTNRNENALTPEGVEAVRRAARKLLKGVDEPTLIEFSLAASSIDTAKIVGSELNMGNNRIRAEFTNLDPRALGLWDGLDRSTVIDAVMAMDYDEAGEFGSGLISRPPENEDGTPHEVLNNQAIRLRQFISVLETSFSGDTILLVFPDGIGPGVLTAMMGGLPLNRVHELELSPGEIRLNLTPESARALLPSTPSKESMERIERGRIELKKLRAIAPEGFIRITDEKLQSEFENEQARTSAEEKRKNMEKTAAVEEQKRLKEEQQRAAAARADEVALAAKKENDKLMEDQRRAAVARADEIAVAKEENKRLAVARADEMALAKKKDKRIKEEQRRAAAARENEMALVEEQKNRVKDEQRRAATARGEEMASATKKKKEKARAEKKLAISTQAERNRDTAAQTDKNWDTASLEEEPFNYFATAGGVTVALAVAVDTSTEEDASNENDVGLAGNSEKESFATEKELERKRNSLEVEQKKAEEQRMKAKLAEEERIAKEAEEKARKVNEQKRLLEEERKKSNLAEEKHLVEEEMRSKLAEDKRLAIETEKLIRLAKEAEEEQTRQAEEERMRLKLAE
eukprot:CAMPEP_0194345894 /NCGR_PEP_ID=MMETSP0171-20130528/105115_1 /TAXON_ID=218684 /ORGANISM="Corethron pennatum, Strain L29A3" /LENGTH=586 /DNA_ID=CAMNT_0039112941 /DNA_START=126 /DNA_END=1883 /DNA_ORIENTATION=-